MRRFGWLLLVVALAPIGAGGAPQGASTLPANRVLTGTLVRPDGMAAPGIAVRTVLDGRVRTVVSGSEGEFELANLPPGTLDLHAGHRWVAVEVPADRDPDPLRLVVPPFEPRVILDVRLANGRSIDDAEVYLYAWQSNPGTIPGGWQSRPVQAGRCALAAEGGDRIVVWVLAPALGYAFSGPIDVSGLEPEVRRTVHLQPGAYVLGRATSADRPAPGVLIVPYQAERPEAKAWNGMVGNGPLGRATHFPSAISLEKDGTFRIGPLPPGHYHMWAYDGLRGYRQTIDIKLNAREVQKGVLLKVPPMPNSASLRGRVVMPGGKPFARQRVYFCVKPTNSSEPLVVDFVESPGQLREVVTDRLGRFRLDPLPAGRLSLMAARGRHPYAGGIIITLHPGANHGATLVVTSGDSWHG